MPKPKPTAANAAVLAAVAPAVAMAVIENMSQHDRCLGFFERATTAARTFTELGKLHYAIQKDLKSGEKIYVVLRALAGKDEAAAKRVDSAISNASYASRVYAELVATGGKGALTEAQFDALTFLDCTAICKVMSGKSGKQLSAPEVVLVIKAAPKSYRDELTSICETGLDIAEAAAKKKQDDAAAAQAAKDAENEKIRVAAEKLAAANAPTGTTTAATSAPAGKAASTPAAGTPSPAPSGNVAAGKIVQLPPQNPDDNQTLVLDMIAEITVQAAGMSEAVRKTIADALMEAAVTLEIKTPAKKAAAKKAA